MVTGKIESVVEEILTFPVKKGLEALKRKEIVIKILKKLRIDTPGKDATFEQVYFYTLVEFGIGKDKPILDFFRDKNIRKAFQRSFAENNPSLLHREADSIIPWDRVGDDLRKIGLDPREEFGRFTYLFNSIVNNARTPYDILQDNRREDMHREILEKLETIQNMEINGIRAKNLEQIQGSLIDRLLTWFKTLGYSIGSGPVSKNDFFELTITIPTRRGVERILVRCVERQAELNDMIGLKKALAAGYDENNEKLLRGGEKKEVEKLGRWEDGKLRSELRIISRPHPETDENQHKRFAQHIGSPRRGAPGRRRQEYDEGWLIASRRKADGACEMAEQEKNLFCYTFDELLDEHADFTRYFDWLKKQVEDRGIDNMYIPLACKKDIFDPDKKEKIGEERYDKKNGWIEGYIDRWVQDSSKEHISILGEFGTGKTWFTLRYAYEAMLKYLEAKEKSLERPRLPVVIQLRDYAKVLTSESLFSDFFFHKHEIPLPGYSAFEYLNRIGKLLLIFDGFDEMADKLDRQKMINNFWELARVVTPGAKAILTCRNEHFPDAKEGRALLNAELKASVMNLTGEPPQFEVLLLEQFDDEQIRQALKNRAGDNRTVEYIMKHPLLLDMARRPVLMEYILECIPEIESGKPLDLARVYLYALHKKLDTDLKSGRTFTSLADKLYFMCELSWEMLTTGNMSMNYRLFPDRLKNLFGAVVAEEKTLDHWHYDMMGNTMLIRNEDGDYTPAHKSLLEFFAAIKLTAALGFLPADFTDLARDQSHVDESGTPGDYTWDAYFCRRADANGEIRLIAPLKRFKASNRHRLMEQMAGLPEAVIRFIHEITNVDEVRGAFHSFLQDTLEEFKNGNREPAKEQGVIAFVYRMARLSQDWEEEAGAGRHVKESWEKFHRGEIRTVQAISTTEILIPGPGDGKKAELPLKMVRIPAGSFLMGDDEFTPIHRVHITKPFLVSAVPVTNRLFSFVMGKTPGEFKGDNRPVEQVSWFDAVEFCNRLSHKAGLKKVYAIDGENVKPDWGANGFRLPTEAEWEYSCRAGTSGQRYGEIDQIAWYDKNSNNSTQDVGKKEPNAWGLYDMLGNVYEWCWDWYGDYPKEDREDWRGPVNGSFRVLRGGYWGNLAPVCRAAYRYCVVPALRDSVVGFRLLRSF